MSLLLLAIQILFSLYLFIFRKKIFIYWFIALNILIPAGIGSIIGSINFSYTRVSSLIFPILLVTLYKIPKSKLKNFSVYIILFSAILFSSIISSVISNNTFSSYIGYLTDDFFQTIGVLYLFAFYYEPFNNKKLKNILKSLLIVTFLTISFGIIEILYNKNIYEIFGFSQLLNSSYHGSLYRDNIYRISSVFNDTLQFGYFIALIFPLLLLSIKIFTRKSLYYSLGLFCIILSFPIMFFISSRTSLIMYISSILFIISIKIFSFLSKKSLSKRIFFIILIFVVAISIFRFEKVFNITNDLLAIEREVINDESIYQRSKQFEYFKNMFVNNKIFIGQGRINTYDLIINTNFLNALDSMLIRLFLESGIISSISYLILLLIPIIDIIKRIINIKHRFPPEIYLFASFIGFLVMTFFSSNQDLRILLFCLIFINIYLKNNLENEKIKKKRKIKFIY